MPLPADLRPGRRLLRDDAHSQLRELIVTGALEPGEPLRDADLGRWLGASRTPVREALTRLADEGLVEMAPNRYTRVSALDAESATEAHILLALVDGELGAAGAKSVGVVDAIREESERFTWALWRGDHADAFAADRTLHATLRRSVGNTLLARTVERTDALARRAQKRAWPALAAAWPADVHAHLLRGLENADGEAVRDAIAAEWRALGDVLAAALAPEALGR